MLQRLSAATAALWCPVPRAAPPNAGETRGALAVHHAFVFGLKNRRSCELVHGRPAAHAPERSQAGSASFGAPDTKAEAVHARSVAMIREQMINFLQAVVVVLLLTNAFSVMAAVWALRIASGTTAKMPGPIKAAQRKVGAVLGRTA